MLQFDKTIYLSFLFKFILFVRLSNSLRESDILLFPEFINIVSFFVFYLYCIILVKKPLVTYEVFFRG